MPPELYLLDTSVLIALMNGKSLGQYIDGTYGLSASKQRPLASVVSHGELWALAAVNGFGEPKRQVIATMLASVVTVGLEDTAIIEAYVAVYRALRRHPRGSRTNIGENDMWIAAAARATDATLLTTDQHFIPLFPDTVRGAYISPSSRLPSDPPTNL